MSKLGHQPSNLRLLRHDQVIIHLLIVLVLGGTIARYMAAYYRAPRDTQVLRARDEIAYRVDLNSAGPAELVLRPGIGPAKAGAIIRHRETHGPFRSLPDLMAVPGVSRRTACALEGLVTPDAAASGEPAR